MIIADLQRGKARKIQHLIRSSAGEFFERNCTPEGYGINNASWFSGKE